MSREIKFRAWDKREKNFIYFNAISGIYAWVDTQYLRINILFPFEQCIVTEDGQDIYENDIIEEWKHGRLLRIFIADDIRTFTREYDKSEHSSVWKVIGNIHENKELLND